jgi:hypothetical protein
VDVNEEVCLVYKLFLLDKSSGSLTLSIRVFVVPRSSSVDTGKVFSLLLTPSFLSFYVGTSTSTCAISRSYYRSKNARLVALLAAESCYSNPSVIVKRAFRIRVQSSINLGPSHCAGTTAANWSSIAISLAHRSFPSLGKQSLMDIPTPVVFCILNAGRHCPGTQGFLDKLFAA